MRTYNVDEIETIVGAGNMAKKYLLIFWFGIEDFEITNLVCSEEQA